LEDLQVADYRLKMKMKIEGWKVAGWKVGSWSLSWNGKKNRFIPRETKSFDFLGSALTVSALLSHK
jgi:hypothetical protein